MKRALSTVQKILGQKAISHSDLVNVMSKFRLVIEDSESQQEYPTLALYSNWVVHPRLDRGRATEMIEQLNAAFLQQLNSRQEKWISDVVIEMFGLHLLHEEIKAFGKSFGISIGALAVWENWVRFAWGLIDELQERPIALADPAKSKKAATKLTDLSSLWEKAISRPNPLISIKFARNDKEYIWVIELFNGALYLGQMAVISQEMVDNYKMPPRTAKE